MSCNPTEGTIPFRLAAFEALPFDKHGLYSFWYKRTCIYVGKAENSSIRKRLTEHWTKTHNDYLADWINAKGPDLRIKVKVIETRAEIEIFERFFIRKFKPLANKTS
jgi:excinuclease UvrABC nuclease subunit